jgi:hypothetical protein
MKATVWAFPKGAGGISPLRPGKVSQHLPGGAGPRSCGGVLMNYAMVLIELELALLQLVAKGGW